MRRFKPGKIRAVVFDLDDTLYDQRQHLAEAFRSVGRLLEELFGLNPEEVAGKLLRLARVEGSASGRLFDHLLEEYGIKPERGIIGRMVSAFYAYKPSKLKPYRGVVETLQWLKKRGLKLGLLTDGRPELQRAKLKALGLEGFFDAILITDEFGRDFRKPNSAAFLEIARRLNVKPEETAYVGDNPLKDFLGARKAGMAAIRVLTGEYRRLEGGGADLTLKRLPELKKVFRSQIQA